MDKLDNETWEEYALRHNLFKIKYEDNVRMTTSTLGETQTTDPLLVRRKLKADFVNNTTTATINGQIVPERQALSQVLKPKADN